MIFFMIIFVVRCCDDGWWYDVFLWKWMWCDDVMGLCDVAMALWWFDGENECGVMMWWDYVMLLWNNMMNYDLSPLPTPRATCACSSSFPFPFWCSRSVCSVILTLSTFLYLIQVACQSTCFCAEHHLHAQPFYV